MRVAVVSDLVRPNGAGVMALLAADLLTKAGHEVAVFAGAMQAELTRQLQHDHVEAGAFTNDERALDGSVTATDHQAFTTAFKKWLATELDAFGADVLYVHNCGRVLSQLDLADWSRVLPVVHTMHDEWFITDAHYTFAPGNGGAMIRTFEPGRSESVLEHRYDHLFDIPERAKNLTLIGPSEWLTNRARAVFPTIVVEHLPNAVDTTLFDLQDRRAARELLGLPHDRSIVLFVGNPTQPRKGFAAFEQAVRHTISPDGQSPLRLVAGGSGSVAVGQAAELLDASGPLAKRLAVPDSSPVGQMNIAGDGLVLSGLDRSLMPALYGAADVLVHPSRIDNLPTVPIEAGLCGTRCLASNVGGTAETVADVADLFDVDIPSAELGARITDALADAAVESENDREKRRALQLLRFNTDAHQMRLIEMLELVTSRTGAVT